MLWLCSVGQNKTFDTHIDVVAISFTMPPYPTIPLYSAILTIFRGMGKWQERVAP